MVMSLTLGQSSVKQQLGKLLTPSVTKQYNLVPAKGWWRSAAEKVSKVWHRTGHVS